MAAYDMYHTKFNAEKQMRATLGDPYKNAWDTWPERVFGGMTMIVLSWFRLTSKRRSSKGRRASLNASGAELDPS